MKKSKLRKLHKALTDRAEAAEARYLAALERANAAEARADAAMSAREKAAAERDAIANARDRTANERDAIANAREKTAADRGGGEAVRRILANGAGDAANPAANPATSVAGLSDTRDPEMELAQLEARLQRAHLDALTGAYRREMGRLALKNEIDRARRSDGRFVIAFVDVDGLKGVNDRDGHAAGDRILRTLVATMRANLRSYDPIVRFGGDEFILGIASIDPSEAEHRLAIIDQSMRTATGVGITAGFASLESNESLEELTARADAALIQNKRARPN